MVTEVKSFLGLAGYYKRLIKGFSQIVLPLANLTRKNSNGCQNVKETSRS